MGKPYSLDLRERVVMAIESGETRVSVSKRHGISLSTVGRCLRLRMSKGRWSPSSLGAIRATRWRITSN